MLSSKRSGPPSSAARERLQLMPNARKRRPLLNRKRQSTELCEAFCGAAWKAWLGGGSQPSTQLVGKFGVSYPGGGVALDLPLDWFETCPIEYVAVAVLVAERGNIIMTLSI